MAYQIEFEQIGAVAYFSEDVSFRDLLAAERELARRSYRLPLRFVISVFLNTKQFSCSDMEYEQLNTVRYRGYAVRRGIKFAVVTGCESLKALFLMNHESNGVKDEGAVFSSFMDAVSWACV